MRNRKRQKKFLAVLAQIREEDRVRSSHSDPYSQVSAPVLATHPVIPVCGPVTPEQQAQVIRKLWGGVDPVGNGFAAFPAQTVQSEKQRDDRHAADNAAADALVAQREQAGVRPHRIW